MFKKLLSAGLFLAITLPVSAFASQLFKKMAGTAALAAATATGYYYHGAIAARYYAIRDRYCPHYAKQQAPVQQPAVPSPDTSSTQPVEVVEPAVVARPTVLLGATETTPLAVRATPSDTVILRPPQVEPSPMPVAVKPVTPAADTSWWSRIFGS